MRMIARVRLMLFVVVFLGFSALSFGQIGITVSFGPPALPVYEQPPCPDQGYIWTPGYWAWDPDAGQYYWVPGTWVLAPEPGYLWTPPWWGWGPGGYFFHAGFWGPRIGFYGGINYGYGYFGNGYEGGRWEDGRFFYNRSVNNVNVTNIHNTYNTTIINNNITVNRVSYNGGNGGINARPTPQEEAVDRERHIPPVAAQTQHVQQARSNPQLRAQVNHGKPPIAATPKPAVFTGRNVVHAKEAGAAYRPPAERQVPRPNENATGRPENNVPRPTHAGELSHHQVPQPLNTGNPRLDQKYAQQQQKLYNKMNQQHQQLEQKQARQDQRLQQQHASEAQRQQMEQRHAQQTQQMQARHQQQIQKLQQRQAPPQERQGPPRPK